ncbi:MAG: alpha/beta fold hydrolase [Candidatus Bathyarchaeia archaeon]
MKEGVILKDLPSNCGGLRSLGSAIKTETVVFQSGGLRLYGNLHMPAKSSPCIITLHGLESSKDSGKWPLIARKLAMKGYACLRFNFRGCGEGLEKSQGSFEETSLTSRIEDYRAAIDFLEKSGKVEASRLGVIGSSMGGMVAITAQDPRIKVMTVMATPCESIGLGKPHRFRNKILYYALPSGRRLNVKFYKDMARHNLLEAVKKAPPILIIHGSCDPLVPVEHAQRLYKAASEPKRLEVIEGADHVFSNPIHLDKAINLILEWFHKYL